MKWTKVGGCLDWVFAGISVHCLLPELHDTALRELGEQLVAEEAKAGPIIFDCAWPACRGKYIQDGRDVLGSSENRSTIVMLVLVFLPLR